MSDAWLDEQRAVVARIGNVTITREHDEDGTLYVVRIPIGGGWVRTQAFSQYAIALAVAEAARNN